MTAEGEIYVPPSTGQAAAQIYVPPAAEEEEIVVPPLGVDTPPAPSNDPQDTKTDGVVSSSNEPNDDSKTSGASVTAPAGGAKTGEIIEVGWTGPANANDFIGIGAVGKNASPYINYTYLHDSEDNLVGLQMPPEPGDYEIKYMMEPSNRVLARVPIILADAPSTVKAPSQATTGSTITVEWTGPENADDFIGIGAVGKNAKAYINYTYLHKGEGNSVSLEMPPKPGDYEIKYMMETSNRVLARVPITLANAPSTVKAPSQATTGSIVEVEWTGPENPSDFIGIGAVGKNERPYINYTYLRDGEDNMVGLEMPHKPGDYEIKYMMEPSNGVLSLVSLVLTDAPATVTAPGKAIAGSIIEVAWTGPENASDFIGIGTIGKNERPYINYTYLHDGEDNLVGLEMPPKPGDYEIKYMMETSNRVLARVGITLE